MLRGAEDSAAPTGDASISTFNPSKGSAVPRSAFLTPNFGPPCVDPSRSKQGSSSLGGADLLYCPPYELD